MEAVLSQWESQIDSPSARAPIWRKKITQWFSDDSPERLTFAYPMTDALPGIAITTEVAEAEDQRRTIQGMLVQLAVEQEISKTTLHSAAALLSSLPLDASLPKIAVDDGGVLMTWTVAGQGRTLVSVVDNVLHAVINSGTPGATYFSDIPFNGMPPSAVLNAIPR